MKYPRSFATVGFLCLAALSSGVHAQAQSGFKGFLQRTANAITGSPAAPPAPAPRQGGANTSLGGGTIPGTFPGGQAVTDGPVFRPDAGSRSEFKGIFDGYSIPTAVARGTYPRVAVTFETYGASEACWTVRARIWQSAKDHHDEHFQLCDAPLTGTDDLGNPVVHQDPSFNLMAVAESQRYMSKPTYTVTSERTEGPNPPETPFALNIGSAPNIQQFRTQYHAMVARLMVISGYVSAHDATVGNMRMGGLAGSSGQLLWIAGFKPGGNRDQPAP